MVGRVRLDKRQKLLSTAALAMALLATPAWAQSTDTEDEIVVTAQRREEASSDVPITVTTLNADQLASANVNQLVDTARLTTALRFDTQGPAMQPTIRGVGTAVTTSGGGPNVGIYVDGFFNANTYVSNFDLMNVENIQVLKGPQGTLFGRNTTGGAILVTTAEPSSEPEARLSASYGNFNAVRLQGYGTFGLNDNVAVDVEGLYRSGDGYMTDLSTGADDIGAYENWSIRAGVRVDLTPNVTALLRYIHAETDDPTTQLVNAYVDEDGGADFFRFVSAAGQAVYGTSSSLGLPLVYFFAPSSTYATRPGDVLLNPPLSFNTESDTLQATVQADLGFADFTSYTQYRTDDSPYYGDLDATALTFFNIFVGVEDETLSQEFLLNSKPGGRLQWTAGLNFFRIEDTWDVGASFGTPFAPFGGSSTTTTSYAAFVDGTYELADRWFLTAGARYSYDVVSDAYFTTNFTTTFYEGPQGQIIPVNPLVTPPGTRIAVDDLENDSLTPRVVLRYEPDDVTSIYASYTRGYKAGILNVGGLSQLPVEPEEIDAFELGYKFDNRTLAIDLAAFYYDYQNLQFSSFQNGAAQIRNAEASEIMGLEGQFRWRPTDALSLYGGAAWTHAEYQSFENAPYYSFCDPAPGATGAIACVPPPFGAGAGALTQVLADASGLQMQRSPEWTANIGAAYDTEAGGGLLTLSGNLYYTSEFFFDANEQFKQDAYHVLSLRAQWADPSDRYTLAVFGDNVTDERYQTQVLFNTLGIGSVWSAPAVYGVSVSARF